MNIKDPPWSLLQYLCPNRVVLSDDSHFAIYNLETHKIQTSFDELSGYKSDIYAVFVTRNSATILILLKNEQLIVFDILAEVFYYADYGLSIITSKVCQKIVKKLLLFSSLFLLSNLK